MVDTEKLERFRERVTREQTERARKQYPTMPEECILRDCVATVRPGKRWIKVDVGTSGKFMIDQDGAIYGIKGYGVPHLGHHYGTLDTLDAWYWGEFRPMPATSSVRS